MQRSAHTLWFGSVVQWTRAFARRTQAWIAGRLTTPRKLLPRRSFAPRFGPLLACLLFYGPDTGCAAEGQESATLSSRRQLAAAVSAFEVAQYHVQQWESNEAARALVAQMMDDIASSAKLDTTWESRFLTSATDDLEREPDDFERTAMQKLSVDSVALRQYWSRDGQRVVAGMFARKSCTNCHDVRVGNIVAYVSLRFKATRK